ncbi:otopetrin-2-like [Tropilaelaps mercedesae]|uniref:Otopetrin-2-like n=1 Tax=Tropilaelaps mercedesae TaxID=418985 RepID=A0A1V9XJY9_9ACAR|nr:otopetrin-2-like [Tropilaelaps mercedesae]
MMLERFLQQAQAQRRSSLRSRSATMTSSPLCRYVHRRSFVGADPPGVSPPDSCEAGGSVSSGPKVMPILPTPRSVSMILPPKSPESVGDTTDDRKYLLNCILLVRFLSIVSCSKTYVSHELHLHTR